MKHKMSRTIRLGTLLLIIILCITVNTQALDWTKYQNSSTNNGVTENPGPTDANHAVLKWSVKMPAATTPPLIIGERVYAASGKYVYCYDKATGIELGRSEELQGRTGFALHPMVYADNCLFVATVNGGSSIEALDLSNPNEPKLKWTSEPQPGACYSPLTYMDGCLYTGTSNGENSGYYFCVDADNGQVKWSMEEPNGFYWAGAYATEKYVAFASENAIGGNNEDEGSVLYTVDAKTGESIDSIDSLKGSIRNTVVYDDGHLYIGTVAGRVYRISVDDSGIMGEYSEENSDDFSYVDLGGRIKATMLIDQGQLYVGVEGKDGAQSSFRILDSTKPFNQFSDIGSLDVPIEPKGAPLLSTAEGETRHIYFTCNDGTGAIYHFTNRYQTEEVSSYDCLFMPEESQQEKCISSLALDDEGTLYYTNDSHYLIAVAPKLIQNIEITASSEVRWNNQSFDPAVKSYNLTVGASVSEVELKIEKVNGEDADVTCECMVNGSSQGNDTLVSLNEGTTAVELKIKRKGITLSYTFNIEKTGSDCTELGLLYYGQNYYSGDNYLPAIEMGKTEYSVDLNNVTADNPYLWILPYDRNASVEVYAEKNVKDEFGDLNNGDILDYIFEEKTGELKYDIVPSDSSKNTVIRITVTSADRTKTQDYQVKFMRTYCTQGHGASHDEIKNLTPATTSSAGSYDRLTICDDCDTEINSAKVEIPKIETVSLSETKLTYTGLGQMPALIVKDAKGNSLKKDTDYTVSGLVKKTNVGNYTVKVTFKGSYSGTESLDFTIVPKAPSSATAALTAKYGASAGYDDVKFSWSKSTGASAYEVYCKKSSESDYTKLGTVTGTTYYEKNLEDGVKYTFKVIPYYKDSKGETHYSTASKTATVYTLKKLPAPTLSRSGSKVKVKWTNISGETGYQISKSKSKTGTSIVSTYATTSGKYKLISAKKGKNYYYKVRAYKKVDGKKIYGPWSNVKKYKR